MYFILCIFKNTEKVAIGFIKLPKAFMAQKWWKKTQKPKQTNKKNPQ